MKTILVDAVSTLIIAQNGVNDIFKEMYDLLETYPNEKIVMTGANDEQWKPFGLDKSPYVTFTLKHNPEKTDPKYFEIFLKEKGLTASDVIYFEHNPDAVKSAESVGIKSYWYDDTKVDLVNLKKWLDENV